jgi:hypothetical protein
MTTIDTITGIVVRTNDERSTKIAQRVELNRRLLQAGVPLAEIRGTVDRILSGDLTIERVLEHLSAPAAASAAGSSQTLRRVVIDDHPSAPKRPILDPHFRGPNRRGFNGKGGHSFR